MPINDAHELAKNFATSPHHHNFDRIVFTLLSVWLSSHNNTLLVYVLSFNDYYFCCFNFIFMHLFPALPIRLESRETAYIHAINAAALAWSITRACSRGDLTECSCDNSIRRKQRKWQWGGCSEVGHIQYRQHISIFSTWGSYLFSLHFFCCCPLLF